MPAIVEPPPRRALPNCIETFLIFAAFAFYGGWPVPDVNEAHYLFKARHFIDPTFLANDFFLNSAEAHGTFYWLFGWLTQTVSFGAAAWLGRSFCWLLLALGWQRLCAAFFNRSGLGLLGALLYVPLCEHSHMAGEWVVGGFESKPIAYACVFLGLAEIVRRRWNIGLAFVGLATFLHVLVGGWSLVACGLAWVWNGKERPSLKSILPGLGIAAALAAAGAIPALRMNAGVDPGIIAEAQRIYVFERLGHHLNPFAFKLWFIERHALLFCIWVALCCFVPNTPQQRPLRGFVSGAMLITLAGWIIALVLNNHPTAAAGLLRFYWFRLGDVILPLGVTLLFMQFVAHLKSPRCRFVAMIMASLFVVWNAWQTYDARSKLVLSRSDPPTKVIDALDWQSACHWIRDNTPSDAMVLAPRAAQTFKWHARRAEVANWKDVPQNAHDLVEWFSRMDVLHATHSNDPEDRWYDSLAEAGKEHALQGARRYGASYLLTAADPPLALPVGYRNNSYVVYELPADAKRADSPPR